jgi:hypothetical protein
LLTGSYVDPAAGRTTVGEWAGNWLAQRVHPSNPRRSLDISLCSNPECFRVGGGLHSVRSSRGRGRLGLFDEAGRSVGLTHPRRLPPAHRNAR